MSVSPARRRVFGIRAMDDRECPIGAGRQFRDSTRACARARQGEANPSGSWFVAIAKPRGLCKATTDHRDRLSLTGDGGLFAAERELLFMGFEVFVPRDRFLRMHRGERLQIERALLNRYMFVRGSSVHLICQANSVSHVLTDRQGKPAQVPDTELDHFRELQQVKPVFGLRSEFPRGAAVEVIRGPWLGTKGTVKRIKERASKAWLDTPTGKLEVPVTDLARAA